MRAGSLDCSDIYQPDLCYLQILPITFQFSAGSPIKILNRTAQEKLETPLLAYDFVSLLDSESDFNIIIEQQQQI